MFTRSWGKAFKFPGSSQTFSTRLTLGNYGKIQRFRATVMNMILDLENLTDWRDLPLSNPKGKLRVGTLFSGIGAIEHAL